MSFCKAPAKRFSLIAKSADNQEEDCFPEGRTRSHSKVFSSIFTPECGSGEILHFAQDDTRGGSTHNNSVIGSEKFRLERIGALAELDGYPFHFGHFFDGPAAAFAPHAGVFDAAEGHDGFVVHGWSVQVDHAGFQLKSELHR